jgi:hypothetical protein
MQNPQVFLNQPVPQQLTRYYDKEELRQFLAELGYNMSDNLYGALWDLMRGNVFTVDDIANFMMMAASSAPQPSQAPAVGQPAPNVPSAQPMPQPAPMVPPAPVQPPSLTPSPLSGLLGGIRNAISLPQQAAQNAVSNAQQFVPPQFRIPSPISQPQAVGPVAYPQSQPMGQSVQPQPQQVSRVAQPIPTQPPVQQPATPMLPSPETLNLTKQGLGEMLKQQGCNLNDMQLNEVFAWVASRSGATLDEIKGFVDGKYAAIQGGQNKPGNSNLQDSLAKLMSTLQTRS